MKITNNNNSNNSNNKGGEEEIGGKYKLEDNNGNNNNKGNNNRTKSFSISNNNKENNNENKDIVIFEYHLISLNLLKLFLQSKLLRRCYFLLTLLASLSVLILFMFSSQWNETKVEINETQSSILYVLFILFMTWECFTIFIPYLTVRFLENIILSKDFYLLYMKYKSHKLIQTHYKFVIFNFTGTIISIIIYGINFGALPGLSFALVCSLPVTISMTLIIFYLQLIHASLLEYIEMLKVDNWWNDDLLFSNLLESGDYFPPQPRQISKLNLNENLIQTNNNDNNANISPLLLLPSSSSSTSTITSSSTHTYLLQQYYSLLCTLKICTSKRGVWIGFYLFYTILILIILIGLSYYYHATIHGLIGIIIVTDIISFQVVIYLAHINEIGYQIQQEYLGIYALKYVGNITNSSKYQQFTTNPLSNQQNQLDTSFTLTQPSLSLRTESTSNQTNSSSVVFPQLYNNYFQDILHLLQSTQRVPLEVKILNCLVVRYRIAFAVVWGLSLAIIPRIFK